MLDALAPNDGTMKTLIEKMFEEYNTGIYTGHKLKKVEKDGIIIENKDKEEKKISYDRIVTAVGVKPNKELAENLTRENIPFYEI